MKATKYTLTEEHRAQLKPHAEKWIANAMSTKAMTEEDREICRDAVKRLYAAANQPPPKNIVFVPSPFVLRFASGLAAEIWRRRNTAASTRDAIRDATCEAIYAATRDDTYAATREATYEATRDATADATHDATDASTADATHDAIYDAIHDATYDDTYDATRDATADATYEATRDATSDATREATYGATDAATAGATADATYGATAGATDDATYDATDEATYDATRASTRDATRDATREAIYAATRDATAASTDDATDASTDDATSDATHDATYEATYDATYDATDGATADATDEATAASTDDATRAATRAATSAATHDATRDATYDATDDATRDATRDASYDATSDATAAATAASTDAATYAAARDATDDDKKWYKNIPNLVKISDSFGLGSAGVESVRSIYGNGWQGGNQWSAWPAFISFFRHVAKLDIDYSKWDAWETLALHSGPRVVHRDFCMISDRPEVLMVDEDNQPHCETGPFCKWRDGTALYAIHGIRVPAFVVENPEKITAAIVDNERNAEVKRIMIERMGFERYVKESGLQVFHADKYGTLYRNEVIQIVHVVNTTADADGTHREYYLPVNSRCETAHEAVASTFGLSVEEYSNLLES